MAFIINPAGISLLGYVLGGVKLWIF